MSRRTICRVAAAVVATAVAATHLAAQTPATPPRNQRVWTGTIDDREIMLNAHDTTPIRRPVRYYKDVNVRFRFVSEDDPNRPGYIRWVSRRLSWTGYGLSSSTIAGRECSGSGSLELGPADNLDTTTTEQEAQLNIPCRDWDAPNVWSFIPMPNPKVRFPIIDGPRETIAAPSTLAFTGKGIFATQQESRASSSGPAVARHPMARRFTRRPAASCAKFRF